MKNGLVKRLHILALSVILVVGNCAVGVNAQEMEPITVEQSTTEEDAIDAEEITDDALGANPYNPNVNYNCTYWAWQKAYENTGVQLPAWGNAKDWYSSAINAGYSVGKIPQARSIAVWDAGGLSSYGHVAYVTEYNSSTGQIYIQEGGYIYSSNGYHEGWSALESSYNGPLLGFIYLGGPVYSGAPVVTIEAGEYCIYSAVGTKVLDIDGAKNENGTNLQLHTPNGTAAQIFTIGFNNDYKSNTISLINTGKFIDTDKNIPGQTNVQLWEGNGCRGQQWFFEDAGNGFYYIRNDWGYYLDVVNGENKDRCNVQVYPFNGGYGQKWKIARVSGKTNEEIKADSFTIYSAVGDKVLDIVNGSHNNGANLQIYTPNGSEAQVFELGYSSSYSAYYFSLKDSGKFIDTEANTNGQSNVFLWEGTGAEGQQWYIEDAGKGYYYIRNVWGYYLDAVNGENKDGTNVQVYAFNGSDNQKWKLKNLVCVNGHTPGKSVVENDIPSTCTKAGSYDEVVYCTVEGCHAEIKRTTISKAIKDHVDNDSDGYCDSCKTEMYLQGLWIKKIDDQVYTGKAIIPQISVYEGKKKLVKNQDYTVKITNNVNVGKAVVYITGRGNYSSVETASFNIVPRNIAEDSFASKDITIRANGREQKPKPVLTWNGKVVAPANYTYTYTKPVVSFYEQSTIESLKEPGCYVVTIKGKGNFTGSRTLLAFVTEAQVMVSALTVAKIPSQQYTGKEITPAVKVMHGKTELVNGEDYSVSYINNTDVGTATAIINGLNKYAGTRYVTFTIAGTPITKATVEGVPTAVTYSGNAIECEEAKLYIKATANTKQINLNKGTDYVVSYINNDKVGTATVVFTGINGYTGAIKRNIKINTFKASEDVERFNISIPESVEYSKGGARPEVNVTYMNGDGSMQTLAVGKDYTLTYTNNMAVNDGSNSNKLPTVKINLKGNYSGSISRNFVITAKELSTVKIEAADKVYVARANVWKSLVTLTDLDGKKLVAGKDYGTIEYAYLNGRAIQAGEIVKAGSVIIATATAKVGSNYIGKVSCTYRITQATIEKARVTINSQTYTGTAIKPKTSDMTVKVGTVELVAGKDYEIINDSYSNNINKGTASVTIRGIGNYGGIRKVNFTIKAKGFSWWWR